MAGQPSEGNESSVDYRDLFSDVAYIALLGVSFTSLMGSNAVHVALPRIQDVFAVTDAEIGLVMTAFYLPLPLMLPLTGVLADMYGRRRIVIPSLVLFGLSGIGMLFINSFSMILLLRGLQGVAFAGTVYFVPTLIGDLYTGPAGSAAQGIRSGINGVANIVAPVAAGVLAAVAWNYPFFLFVLLFPTAGIVYWYYPEPVEPVRRGKLTGIGLRAELTDYWTAIRRESRGRTLPLLFLGGFVLFFVKQGIKTYVPLFVVREIGGNLTAAGIVLGVYGGVRTVTAPTLGWMTAKAGRWYMLLLSVLAVALGTAAIPLVSTTIALGLAISLYAIGEALLNPLLNATIADYASDSSRGGIMSGLQTLKTFAYTVSPLVLGVVLATSGFGVMFAVAVLLAVGYGAIVSMFLDKSEI